MQFIGAGHVRGEEGIRLRTDAGEAVYFYDVATGKVTKGLSIAPGYYFDQIRLFED